MNVCFYLSDKFILPLFEGVFLLLFICALLHEKGFLRKQSNLKMSIKRGEKGWEDLTLVFGIASIVLMQIINSADALHGYKTIISITNLFMLIVLVFYNGWCRNKIIGLITRSKTIEEKR
jgi:hypothetical protein